MSSTLPPIVNDPALSPTIREQRETAYRLLDPTDEQLEKGLAIHFNSLVAESYSLGLHAPAVPEEVNKIIDEGASPSEIRDLLEEQWMLGWQRTPELQEEYVQARKTAGVSCLFLNAGQEGSSPLRLLKRFARYVALTDAMPDKLVRATSVEGIRNAYQEKKHSLCLTLNGIPLAGQNENVQDELQYVRLFAQLGARMMHLTYNRANPIGSGCGEPKDRGLTEFGQHVVAEMNRLGVIIDMAHTGWQTTLDVCEITTQPVVVSHSAVHALSGHIRAKNDEVIKAVLATGGVMSITNHPVFLGRTGDINAFMDHIDYMVEHYGEDAVAIGTDTAYRSEEFSTIFSQVKPIAQARTAWEYLWPKNDPLFSPEWRQPHQVNSLAWMNWPLFTVGMVKRGHSETTIRKILGENLLRVANAVWK